MQERGGLRNMDAPPEPWEPRLMRAAPFIAGGSIAAAGIVVTFYMLRRIDASGRVDVGFEPVLRSPGNDVRRV
jgi:hypothetical protein